MNDKMKKVINYMLILALAILLTTILIIFGWNLFFATIVDDFPSIYVKGYVVIIGVLIFALIWLCIVKIKKGIILLIISLLVSSMISYVIIRNDINDMYEKGVNYVDNYRYKEAAKCFVNISFVDYKDSEDYFNLCLAYLQYQNGKEQEAYEELQKLDFKYLSDRQQKQVDNLIAEVEAKINEEITTPVIDSSDDKDDVEPDDKPESSYQNPSKEDEEEDEDPYNAKDYATEEDFYDDHYDDFYEFEEAEEYFWEHQE